MEFTLITNNPMVYEKYKDQYPAEYFDVSYEELLKVLRDRVHQGYQLLTHPLSGSIKPNETPYKSALVSRKTGQMDHQSLMIIEDAIVTARKFKVRYSDMPERIRQDFQLIDRTLIDSGIESATTV